MHRKVTRRWWQVLLLRPARCACGLPWPCLEIALDRIRRRIEPPSPDRARPGSMNAQRGARLGGKQ